MGKSSSFDLRDRIVGAIERGSSRRAAARRFGVSAATAVRLAQRKARTGSVAPACQGRPKGSGVDQLVQEFARAGHVQDGGLAALLAEIAAERGSAIRAMGGAVLRVGFGFHGTGQDNEGEAFMLSS